MLALGAMGAVGVVSRLVASGIKSSLAGVTILSGGLAAPLTALGYGDIRPGPGRDRRLDLLRPRPRRQDLSPPGLPVGPARHQDRHPADPRRGQGRLGHRPAPRRPQAPGGGMSTAGRRNRRDAAPGLDRRHGGRSGPGRRPGLGDHRHPARSARP